MRIYLPLTMAGLAEAHESGEVPEDTEKFTAEDDSEESEYDALMTAADASAELLEGPGRRVVLAAEVVGLTGPVSRRSWAAVHVDTDDAGDPDEDLAWFAVQEIGELLASR
ncbi:MAG: hypothetical protein LH477_06385 [Nocardioides sp.]|nr:hypothetical protein [Nocardioides sp.]